MFITEYYLFVILIFSV